MIAFALIVSLVPFVGLVNLALETFRLLKTRRGSPAIVAEVALSVVALWPAAWNFGWAMIVFPSRLERAASRI